MSLTLRSTLSAAIQDALKYIPTLWPLQQFIGTNPLGDLIDQPMVKVIEKLYQKNNIQAHLPLSTYWEYYKKGKISQAAILQSIKEYLNHPLEVEKKPFSTPSDKSTSLHSLYQFMVDEAYQAQVIQQTESLKTDDAFLSRVLLSGQIQNYGYDNALESIQSECLNWLTAYFNPSPLHKKTLHLVNKNAEPGACFFRFWQAIMAHHKKWKTFFAAYPTKPEAFLEAMLSDLSIPETSINVYIFEIFQQLKGFVGYIKWQKQYPQHPYYNQPVEWVEIIAMWLSYETFWLNTHTRELAGFKPNYQAASQEKKIDPVKTLWLNFIKNKVTLNPGEPLSQYELINLWQRAYEISYHHPLYHTLLERKQQINQAPKAEPGKRPCAQWIFCIDVRSEGLRRWLEEVGNYETFGFAGFFGFAHQLIDKEKQKLTHQCPALIEPTLLASIQTENLSLYHDFMKTSTWVVQKSKLSLLSPFALYEMIGLWFAFMLLFKNYGTRCLNTLKKLGFKKSRSTPHSKSQSTSFSTLLEKTDTQTLANLAKELLNGIGLNASFSECVIICGHTATTENNPYQAALDCGACGGNSGFSNALLACQILNKKAVRKALADQGINIPDKTLFIAACHDTATDKIAWYPPVDTLPKEQKSLLDIIKQDALKACHLLQKERLKELPGDQNLIRRTQHWAELIPEWGLANNAAMIIAPRQLTERLDLKRRVFLHSYAPHDDPHGHLLASIFSGPLMVAHWINSQYYFSSLNPTHYSSGNKAIHNILPSMGVMEGNQSDLKYGLPEQCVFFEGERIHEPIRLCVFVDADEKIIHQLVKNNPVLQSLVDGQWIWIQSLCPNP